MHRTSTGPFTPLPGTLAKPRGLFLDLWGTMLELPEGGSPSDAADVRFLEGALDALFRAGQAGWTVYLIGNQEAVAHGHVSVAAWERVVAALDEGLRAAGVVVKRSYVCVDHPEGAGARRNDSVYLLPNTGAFYHASHVDGIELAKSWVVGDSTVELVAGWRSGCRTAAVRTGLALADATFHVEPEVRGADLREVLDVVLSGEAFTLRRA